jgi:HSP20 family molecular chaperone IbpA
MSAQPFYRYVGAYPLEEKHHRRKFSTPVSFQDSDNEIIVQVELPGVNNVEDIDVQLQNGMLSIKPKMQQRERGSGLW